MDLGQPDPTACLVEAQLGPDLKALGPTDIRRHNGESGGVMSKSRSAVPYSTSSSPGRLALHDAPLPGFLLAGLISLLEPLFIEIDDRIQHIPPFPDFTRRRVFRLHAGGHLFGTDSAKSGSYRLYFDNDWSKICRRCQERWNDGAAAGLSLVAAIREGKFSF